MIKIFLSVIILFTPLTFSQTTKGLMNQFLLGRDYIQAGRYEKAKPIYEHLYKTQPSNYRYFQTLNNIYVQLKDYDASIKLIKDRIKLSGMNINLYGLLGKTYYLKGNDQKAFQTWDDALSKLPQKEVNYRVMANYAIERRAFDKAIEYLRRGEAISKNPVYFAYDLGNLYSITMQFKNAAEQYCLILSRNSESLGNIEEMILKYIDRPDALSQTITVVKKYAGNNITFKFLLARLYVEGKKYNKAFNLYLDIDKIQKNQGAELYKFARFLYSEKVYKTAAKTFDEILNKYPNSPFTSGAKLGYAKTLEALLKEESAIKIPTWKPYYNTKLNDINSINEVISAYLKITRLYPHTEVANEALLRIGEIKFYQGNKAGEAKKYFNRIIINSPLSKFAPEAYEQLGKIYISENKLDSAAVEYVKIKSNPRSSGQIKNEANYRLAMINFYKGNFKKVQIILNGILHDLKDNTANNALELSLLLNTSKNDSSNLAIFSSGELLTAQKKYALAEEKYKVVIKDKQPFMLQNLAELRYAEMELALNKTDSAIVYLKKIANEGEKNIYADKALYLAGKIYQYGLNDNKKAIEIYEEILANFPNSLYLDKARDQINKLQENLS